VCFVAVGLAGILARSAASWRPTGEGIAWLVVIAVTALILVAFACAAGVLFLRIVSSGARSEGERRDARAGCLWVFAALAVGWLGFCVGGMMYN
jgi:hypothetical protein